MEAVLTNQYGFSIMAYIKLKACTNKLEYPSEDMHCLNKQTNTNSHNHPQMMLELKTNYFNLGGINIKNEICFIYFYILFF